MDFKRDKFYEFFDFYDRIPKLYALGVNVKVKEFLEGKIPTITLEERMRIEKYLPLKIRVYFNKLTDSVVKEIDENSYLIIPDKSIPRYLGYLLSLLLEKTESLRKSLLIDPNDLPNYGIIAITNLEIIDSKEKADIELLRELIWHDQLYYYLMYNKVTDHVKSIITMFGLREDIIINPLTKHFEALEKKRRTDAERYAYLEARLKFIVLYYKVKVKSIPSPVPSEVKLIGNNEYKQYYTVFSEGKKKALATRKELTKIIPYLDDCPEARELAERDLAKLC